MFGDMPVPAPPRTVITSCMQGEILMAPRSEILMPHVDLAKFQAMLGKMVQLFPNPLMPDLTARKSVKYNGFLAIECSFVEASMHLIYNSFVEQKCDIVGLYGHNDTWCSIVVHRTVKRSTLKIPLDVAITRVWALNLDGQNALGVAALTFDFLEVWNTVGGTRWTNFELKRTMVWTKKEVLARKNHCSAIP